MLLKNVLITVGFCILFRDKVKDRKMQTKGHHNFFTSNWSHLPPRQSHPDHMYTNKRRFRPCGYSRWNVLSSLGSRDQVR